MKSELAPHNRAKESERMQFEGKPPLPTRIAWAILFFLRALFEIFDDETQDELWCCSVCGGLIEDGYHCPNCGTEPPWGCPCSDCQDGNGGDEIFFDEFNALHYDDYEPWRDG